MKSTGKVIKLFAVVMFCVLLIGASISFSKTADLSGGNNSSRRQNDLLKETARNAIYENVAQTTIKLVMVYGIGEIITIIGKESKPKVNLKDEINKEINS